MVDIWGLKVVKVRNKGKNLLSSILQNLCIFLHKYTKRGQEVKSCEQWSEIFNNALELSKYIVFKHHIKTEDNDEQDEEEKNCEDIKGVDIIEKGLNHLEKDIATIVNKSNEKVDQEEYCSFVLIGSIMEDFLV